MMQTATQGYLVAVFSFSFLAGLPLSEENWRATAHLMPDSVLVTAKKKTVVWRTTSILVTERVGNALLHRHRNIAVWMGAQVCGRWAQVYAEGALLQVGRGGYSSLCAEISRSDLPVVSVPVRVKMIGFD